MCSMDFQEQIYLFRWSKIRLFFSKIFITVTFSEDFHASDKIRNTSKTGLDVSSLSKYPTTILIIFHCVYRKRIFFL